MTEDVDGLISTLLIRADRSPSRKSADILINAAAALTRLQERVRVLEGALHEADWLMHRVAIAPRHARRFGEDFDRVKRRCAAALKETSNDPA